MTYTQLSPSHAQRVDVARFEKFGGPPLEVEGEISRSPSAPGFVAMLHGYRTTGGIEREADLTALLDALHGKGASSLSQLITSGQVFGFQWHKAFWVPMFQFNLNDMSVRSRSLHIRTVLDREFDRWALAAWFAHSRADLNCMCPAECIDLDLQAILAVARADRRLAARQHRRVNQTQGGDLPDLTSTLALWQTP